jgi:hypothetical protein
LLVTARKPATKVRFWPSAELPLSGCKAALRGKPDLI